MKFKTFRALLIGAGIVAGVALLGLLVNTISGIKERAELREAQELEDTTNNIETKLLAQLGRPAGADTKIKDMLGASAPKLNIYAEQGVWVRAKVDLDRDDRWDQKWRWDAGVVYRSIAAADDERYGPEQVVGDPPKLAEAPLPTPEAAPLPTTPSPDQPANAQLREIDLLMLQLLTRPVQAKIKDASKGRPFKINIYSDDGRRFNRAKVDIDRDDRWDESWSFGADGSIERECSPADDEQSTERYVLEAGIRWRLLP